MRSWSISRPGGQDEAWRAAWLRLAGSTEAKIAYPVSRKQLNLFLSAYLLFESKAKKDIISDIEQWDLKSEG